MPVTVEVSFEEDDGTWCKVMTAPGDAIDTRHGKRRTDYVIDLDAGALVTPVEPRSMRGTRCWQLIWFKAGQPSGLFVRRLMKVEIKDRAFILRTANYAKRAAQ